MGGKAPQTILTDQCAAMAAARRTAMPNTRHRWCRWHVLKDAKKYLGGIFSKHSGFKKAFKELVTFVTDQTIFEDTWKKLMRKYKLTKNSYLKRLFKYKDRWAKPYFMDIFCAGMTSTQRSESANHMIKSIIQKAAPMHIFVSKFREFQGTRKSDESSQDYATNQVTRKLSTRIPLETHASKVYTKAMHHHFSDQLYQSGSFIIKGKLSETDFILRDTRLEGTPIDKDIHVTIERDTYIHCECGLYEHMGMLCRHAIKVLTNLDKREIPADNILKRWTTWYGEGNNNTEYLNQLAFDNDEMKRKALLLRAFKLSNKEARISNYNFEEAMAALTEGSRFQGNPRTSGRRSKENIVVLSQELPTSCPQSTFKGGRPANTGTKSWVDAIKKQKKKNTGDPEKEASDWPREENPPTKKRRSILDF
ncbi:unnamed protein product [Urochloa humidicola]